MQYFKHSSSMRFDVKIRRLIKKHGIKGYGLYNAVLESIASTMSRKDPLPECNEMAEDLADYYHMDIRDVEEIILFCLSQGLFQQSEISGKLISMAMFELLDDSTAKSKAAREMILNMEQLLARHGVSSQIENVQKISESFPPEEEEEVEKEVEVEKKKKQEAPEYLQLANLLRDLHKKEDPQYSPTDSIINTWAKDIRLLCTKDNRTTVEVGQIIKWVKTPGEFWFPNIMSGKKLREKFPTLIMQAKRDKKFTIAKPVEVVEVKELTPDEKANAAIREIHGPVTARMLAPLLGLTIDQCMEAMRGKGFFVRTAEALGVEISMGVDGR